MDENIVHAFFVPYYVKPTPPKISLRINARRMAQLGLSAAKTAKKDEFYTQMTDIERELQHYWPHFRDKVVLCNCDDPYESNFFGSSGICVKHIPV